MIKELGVDVDWIRVSSSSRVIASWRRLRDWPDHSIIANQKIEFWRFSESGSEAVSSKIIFNFEIPEFIRFLLIAIIFIISYKHQVTPFEFQ